MSAPWPGFNAQSFTEEILGGPTVAIGKRYIHPEDGEIEIISGQWWGTHGLSNFWDWKVLATGEVKHGYGGKWPMTRNTTPLEEAAWRAACYLRDLSSDNAGEVIDELCEALGVERTGRHFEGTLEAERERQSK